VASRRAALAATLLLGGCAGGQVGALERTLASRDSATAALQDLCTARHLADPARIVAEPVRGAPAMLPGDARTRLNLAAEEAPGYRHVRLSCGGVVLSEAHNWYVPARLTPDMNALLASTDTPFGRVAAPLHFTRERIESRYGRQAPCPAATALSQHGLLRLPDGRPLAFVVECYTKAAVRAPRSYLGGVDHPPLP